MSVRIMSAVFAYDMPNLVTSEGKRVPDSTAKFVLLALADCASDEGEGAYPSIETLCKKTSMSTATVCNAIDALILAGYLYYEGFSKYRTKSYRILVAKIVGDTDGAENEGQDFSSYNRRILVAKKKPLVNPPVTKVTEHSAEIPEQKDLPVVPGTTGWPSDIRDLAIAFAECKGRDPYGHEKPRWIRDLRESYVPAGVTVAELQRMFRLARDSIGEINSPRSMFFVLDRVRGQLPAQPVPVLEAWRENIFA